MPGFDEKELPFLWVFGLSLHFFQASHFQWILVQFLLFHFSYLHNTLHRSNIRCSNESLSQGELDLLFLEIESLVFTFLGSENPSSKFFISFFPQIFCPFIKVFFCLFWEEEDGKSRLLFGLFYGLPASDVGFGNLSLLGSDETGFSNLFWRQGTQLLTSTKSWQGRNTNNVSTFNLRLVFCAQDSKFDARRNISNGNKYYGTSYSFFHWRKYTCSSLCSGTFSYGEIIVQLNSWEGY